MINFLLGLLLRGLVVEDFVILCISWACFILRLSFFEDEKRDSEAAEESLDGLSEDLFFRMDFSGRDGCDGA